MSRSGGARAAVAEQCSEFFTYRGCRLWLLECQSSARFCRAAGLGSAQSGRDVAGESSANYQVAVRDWSEALADMASTPLRLQRQPNSTPDWSRRRSKRASMCSWRSPLPYTTRRVPGSSQRRRREAACSWSGHLLQSHAAFSNMRGLRYVYSNRLNVGKVQREENILWSFAPHDIQ